MTGFTYKSYSFIDKDPIIDEIRTVYNNAGVNYKWIEEHSGVTPATLRNWFMGKTKKPQAATINAVLRSMGYKLGIVQFGAAIRIEPALEQPKESVRHVIQINKYKRKIR